MMPRSKTRWMRAKYLLNGWVLLLPGWFFYQALNPQFPDALALRTLGALEVAPMPFDVKPPYAHDGHYVKDFLLMVSAGDVRTIRQAYLSIGAEPVKLGSPPSGEEGVVHGSQHGLHVHALSPAQWQGDEKIWLVLEQWDGTTLQAQWDLPSEW